MTYKMNANLEPGRMNVEGKRMDRPYEPASGQVLSTAFASRKTCPHKLARAEMRGIPILRILMLLIVAGLTRALGAQGRVLTTLAEVHKLSAAEAAKSLPVHVVATVTYFQPDHFSLFIADKTGGAYIYMLHPGALHPGDLVDVTGVTGPSYRTIILEPTIRIIGKAPLPVARPTDFRQLMSGDMDCAYVSIRATVRSATVERFVGSQVAELVLLAPGGLIQAYIEDDQGMDLDGLIDSEVELSGVAGGVFNARKQLMRTVIHSTDRSEVRVVHAPKVRPRDLPLTEIDDVLPTRYNIDLSQRVRVRGTVTFFQAANLIVIQHEGRSLVALTYEVNPVPLGSVVDVVGFADDRGYGPMLEEAEIIRTGMSEDVAPTPLTYQEAVGGRFSDNLITLHGTVLSELHGDLSDSMVVLVGGHTVNVLMWNKDGAHLPDLPLGSSVAVTGICRLTPTGAWGNCDVSRGCPFDLNRRSCLCRANRFFGGNEWTFIRMPD